ncbi:nucleoside phosphorylase [Oscillospiraceae bacterium MB08-C2-2]|nr:nucleoside phosphorylase [Oscillospiraceae bacterium MB08-C2-2]
MSYVQSKEVLNSKGQQYHICCKKGDVGRYVLLPGDPFRTDEIARHLENAKLVAHNREHKTWTGTLSGVAVSVTSTGMGGPSAAIAIEELIHCGADTFIRVGTCGRICEDSWDKTLEGVVLTGAVRDEGTTRQYIPIEYPAIANRTVTEALVQAAKESGANFTEGLGQSKDSFYGQHDPDSMPCAGELHTRWQAWETGHVMASEMEASTLFVLSSIRGARAGAIMAYESMTENTIQIACNAMKKLIEQDNGAGR